MIATLIAGWLRAKLLQRAGAGIGWVFADWHRVVACLTAVAIVAAYILGDVRGRHAGDAAWQAKLEAQAKAFIAAADRAATAEYQRQVAAGSAAQAGFEKRMRARDAEDAAKDAALAKEIADARAARAKSPSDQAAACAITTGDLGSLHHNSADGSGAPARRR